MCLAFRLCVVYCCSHQVLTQEEVFSWKLVIHSVSDAGITVVVKAWHFSTQEVEVKGV